MVEGGLAGGLDVAQVQDIPDLRVFLAEPLDGDAAEFLRPDRAELVQKGDGVEKADGVVAARLLVAEDRVKAGRAAFDVFDPREAGAAHGVAEGDFLGPAFLLVPVVAVSADGGDPPFGIAVVFNHAQPSLKPVLRGDRPGGFILGGLVAEAGDEVVDGAGEPAQVEGVDFLVHRHQKPEFLVDGVEGGGDLFDQRGEIAAVGGVELLPVEQHAAHLGLLNGAQKFDDERAPALCGSVGEPFDGLGLPLVADQIVEDRDERHPLAGGHPRHLRGEFLKGESALAVHDGAPFQAEMGELGGVIGEGAQGGRIPIGVKPGPDALGGVGMGRDGRF